MTRSNFIIQTLAFLEDGYPHSRKFQQSTPAYLTLTHNNQYRVRCLVGVREAAHAGHDAEDVVVNRLDTDLRRASTTDRVNGDRELERRLVNAGEVARAAGLVLLRLEREGVDVDARRRRARVVLLRLDNRELATLTLREAVLTVELELGNLDRVLALALNTRREDDLGEEVVRRGLEDRRNIVTRIIQERGVDTVRARETNARELRRLDRGRLAERRRRRGLRVRRGVRDRVVAERTTSEDVHDDTLRGPVIRVVERLGTEDLRNNRRRGRAVNERVALDNPDELLDGVVEVELDLVRRGRDRLRARELELLNEVLVRLLREAAALLRVEVDLVNLERRSRERLGSRRERARRDRARAEARRRARRDVVLVAAVDELLELDVDADLVVLERNERDRETRVAAEPELERDVERLRRRARAGRAGVRELRARARTVEREALLVLEEDEVVRVADHVIESRDRARILGELRPDLHPVTVLAVDALTTDLELNLLDESVTDVVEPAETLNGLRREVNRREDDLDVRAVHQVGVTVDDRRDTLVEVRLSVERDLNGLEGEVRVALLEDLPERDLGVTRDVDILRSVGDELHKTTRHCSLCVL